MGLAWDPGITGLDNSTTIMGELVFTREDHLNLPLDFSLAESVSFLSDLLTISKEEIGISSYGRGSFSVGIGS